MQFFSFITLVTLLFIQSQTVHSTYVCDNPIKPRATSGFCTREAVSQKNPGYSWITPAKQVDPQKKNHFSCDNVKVNGAPATERICCNSLPAGGGNGFFNNRGLNDECYSRDGNPNRAQAIPRPGPPRS